MSLEPRPDVQTPPGSDSYQELLAREAQVTWDRSRVGGDSPSHLIDRTAWSEARRKGPLWWQPVIDPEIAWGKELAFVLREARGQVLELGCGGGWLALELARRGLQVTGMDACEPLIEAARKYAQTQGIGASRLKFQAADLNLVSLPEDSYDTVIAWQSLHHLLALPRLMQEIRKTLRPGGSLLVCETVLDHEERSLPRFLLSIARKAAKLALLVAARAGSVNPASVARVRDDEPPACKTDSPFERVGAAQVEAALAAEFRSVETWHIGTWFWEGLPQYAFATMSGSNWQQRLAVALLRSFRCVDRALLRLGFRGNYLAGKFVPR